LERSLELFHWTEIKRKIDIRINKTFIGKNSFLIVAYPDGEYLWVGGDKAGKRNLLKEYNNEHFFPCNALTDLFITL
jgi:hypothetical protein